MDFFERQDQARRSTRRLVGLFALAVLGTVLAVYGVTYLFVRATGEFDSPEGVLLRETRYAWSDGQVRAIHESRRLSRLELLGWVSLGTLMVIGIGTAYRTAELRQGGGGSIATMLGGRPVSTATRDPDERRLLNVVEEMAIASGVPAPQVFLLPEERGINAFAAGFTPSDAVVGVTRGAMKLLTRDELQGVIAHEFSHIFNGDMRLNLRLMGWVFGILGLAVVGRVLLHTRDRKGGGVLLGLGLMLIGWIGVFFGRLIQAAISRQREHLADASAVQFTRNPSGLASALKKIGGLAHGARLSAPRAAEASHLFFADGLKRSFFGAFATHPPLVERIRALDPGFDGKFPVVSGEGAWGGRASLTGEATAAPPILEAWQSPAVAGLNAPTVPAHMVLPRVGSPEPVHLQYARDWRAGLSPEVTAAAQEPLGASALVCALLLSANPALREQQLEGVASIAGLPAAEETRRLLAATDALDVASRLPLLDLAVAGLRQLSAEQFDRFEEALEFLVESDEQVDLFEFMLQKLVRRHLEPHFRPVRPAVAHYYVLKPLLPDAAALVAGMANAGHGDPAEARRAFRAGLQRLATGDNLAWTADMPAADLAEIEAALLRLEKGAPQVKKAVLQACAHAAAADGVLQPEEAELLRAIADTLDCPLPPFVKVALA